MDLGCPKPVPQIHNSLSDIASKTIVGFFFFPLNCPVYATVNSSIPNADTQNLVHPGNLRASLIEGILFKSPDFGVRRYSSPNSPFITQ